MGHAGAELTETDAAGRKVHAGKKGPCEAQRRRILHSAAVVMQLFQLSLIKPAWDLALHIISIESFCRHYQWRAATPLAFGKAHSNESKA
jgi:hypothetical protein